MTTTRDHSTAGNGATHGHASRVGRVLGAERLRKPAERTRSPLSIVFSEAAKVAGQDKSATLRLGPRQKKGKSSLPMCVGCLLAIGWGQKRIVRHTGFAKTSVHRWAKFNGVDLSASAERKKRAEMAVRKRKAATRKAEKERARKLKKAERMDRPKKTAMDWYYANHEKAKERSRVNALARYHGESAAIKAGAEPSKYWVARRIRSRVYNVLRNALAKKKVRTEELCGCSWPHLVSHIESQFCARMSWQNYGRAWHIDHIMPCDSFNLRDERQQRQCFHYTNLRPMWAKANRRKWATVTNPQFSLLLPAT